MNASTQLIQKAWNTWHILRDDRLSYGDTVESASHLLFLKHAHERTRPPHLPIVAQVERRLSVVVANL